MLRSDIELWPHQVEAVKFAEPLRAAGLSMPMGTGKTLTSTALIDVWRPRSILTVSTEKIAHDQDIWPTHLRECITDPYEIVILAGKSPKRRSALYDDRPDRPTAYLLNIEAVWREPFAKELLDNPPEMLLFDESHHGKSPKSKLTRFMVKLARRCKFKLNNTGTMLAQRPSCSYAQTKILDEAILGGSYGKFLDRYAIMGGYMGKEILSGKNGVPWQNQDELAALLAKVWFTCEKPKLPFEVQTITRRFDLSPKARVLYDQFERDFAIFLNSDQVSAPTTLTREVRGMQFCSGFLKTDDMPGGVKGRIIPIDDSRMRTLADILQEIDPAERVAVGVGKFSFDLEMVCLAAKIADRPFFEISGSASQLDEWRQIPGAVLGFHVQSGAEGLDFTMARYLVIYTYQRALWIHNQQIARVLRPPGKKASQTGTRFLIYVVSRDTIEEDLLEGLKRGEDTVQDLYKRVRAKY